MKFFQIKRKTKYENRYSPKMGRIRVKVTRIQQHLLGIPINNLHKYRKTYYGEVKDCQECNLYA